MTTQAKRNHLFSIAVLLTGLLIAALVAFRTPPAVAETLVVYKSPSCGCCQKWVEHMQRAGFRVEVREQYNVTPVKERLGVPRPLRSCHTAQIGGYLIEGHVPADLVRRLLDERPDLAGLAVPGMPMGSPGMEGPRKDAYDVVSFTHEGRTAVYASR